MIAPNMSPPPQTATLSLNQTTTVAGDGGYSQVGTIEGWIQIESNKTITMGIGTGPDGVAKPVVLFADPQRLLTLTGRKLTGEKDEFWIEFVPASEKFQFPNGNSVDAPFADGQFHHFALTLDRDQGLYLAFDGNDPKLVSDALSDKDEANSIFQQLTIGHYKDGSGSEHLGCIGKIAGLHLWKKTLTSAEIRAVGNWHTSICPTPELGFNDGVRPHDGNPPNDAPTELLGFLNPEIPSFTFYYEPKGFWVMKGTEPDEPQQAKLQDCDQHHHAVYEAPRYFLTTREKATNKLYIISDNGDKNPLCLARDQSRQFVFTTDDLILKFDFELKTLSPEGHLKQKAVDESFSIESQPGKELPDEFRPVPPFPSKCVRPTILQENDDLVQELGDTFADKKYNLDAIRIGWNALLMPDPFDSSHTGASNYIFDKPPDKSRCYVQAFGFAVPYGFKFVQTSFAEGRMHSALIANGSDLRSAATTSKSIKANVKGGCAFVSASLAFNYNSELGNTEEDMYNNEVMHSQHTFFSTLYTLVLDKPNVRFSGKGSFKGFWPDIHEYAKGKTSGAEIFANYGTHYAHAISFGARGKAQHSYTKETMSTMLQNCKKLGWGAEAKVSGKIGGFKGGVGGGYSQEDKADDMKKIDATTDFQEGTYECVGSSSCNSSGEAHAVDQTAVPVLVDLRPITELLAPPLFDTYEMTVNVRRRLIADLMIYLAGKEPSTVDVFHFLSLSFSRPRVFYQSDPAHLEEFPGWGVFTCSSPISVKVTGSSNGGKETPLQFQNFSFAQEAPPPIKQAFCYSGPKTDHQVCVEFTLPNTWSYKPMTGDDDWDARVSPEDYPPREMKLEFALDDERLLSAEGVSGTFMLPATKVTWEGQTVPDKPPVIIRFPVVLRKLNLQDAFFNGLPAEWKEAEWKT